MKTVVTSLGRYVYLDGLVGSCKSHWKKKPWRPTLHILCFMYNLFCNIFLLKWWYIFNASRSNFIIARVFTEGFDPIFCFLFRQFCVILKYAASYVREKLCYALVVINSVNETSGYIIVNNVNMYLLHVCTYGYFSNFLILGMMSRRWKLC